MWDLDAHSELIPLTRLSGDGVGGRPLREGARFVARTAVGPLGVDDVMEVRAFTFPAAAGPARAQILKTGRLIRGRIDAEVAAAPGGSVVLWRQEIGLRGLPSLFDPVVALVAKAAYRSVLTRLLARTPDARSGGTAR